MDNQYFERHYKEKGFLSQRRYPNEALLQFFGANYFQLSLNERQNIRVLELGCGSGANLWMVAREGFYAYGIDIAQTGIKLCKQMLNSWNASAILIAENMKNLSFDDTVFDIIFDVTSMQHVDLQGHMDAYREVFRCLKSGGRFFQWHLGAKSISFINGNGNPVDKLTIDNISNPDVPLHNNGLTCFLTPMDAEYILKSVGFTNVSIEVVTRSYKQMTQTIEYLAIIAEK